MRIIYLLFISFVIFSCNTNTQEKEIKDEDKNVNVTPKDDEKPASPNESEITLDKEALIGHYVGMFVAKEYDNNKEPMWSNRINISIEEVTETELKGRSVVAGNDRPFKGTYEILEDKIKVKAIEPGDDKYDGVFEFECYPSKNEVKGIWTANNNKLAVSVRGYNLEKKPFNYQANLNFEDINYADVYGSYNEKTGESEFITADASSKNASVDELTKADVENMKKGDLEVMRNAIYARHGYSFKNRKMRYFFDHYVDWYIPMNTDIRAKLTDLEKQNIDLIKRYEQHAERYYDSFGR